MAEALIIATTFLGIASLVAVPLAVGLGIPLTAWLARHWLALRERELELRRLEVACQLRQSSLLPSWVDRSDPHSLLAWARADLELEVDHHR